ncbi:MAG: hypothetical protein B7Z80_10830 [Rhodospirillales bacterium 20-64-7]|nr:MAG: hypothetical protein B7Z80_10830 [Rhodospirillales bacterium 20-64-7]HQT76315.1 hypothetical protein [Rhodopila sp.]
MRKWLRPAIAFRLLLVASLPLALPAHAQTADPATLDVAGVHLGMTPDEAIAALKAYDPTAEIVDLRKGAFDNGTLIMKQIPWPSTDGLVGNTIWNSSYGIVALSPDFRKQMEANQRASVEEQKCYGRSSSEFQSCTNDVNKRMNEHGNGDVGQLRVTVAWLAPVPGQEKVIAVSTNIGFVGPVPTVAATLAALKQRYAMPFTKEQKINDGPIVWWKFDPRNRLMSQRDAERGSGLAYVSHSNNQLVPLIGKLNDIVPYIALPAQYNGADHIEMMAIVDDGVYMVGTRRKMGADTNSTFNTLLAPSAHVVLYDSHALGLYQTQAQAFVSNKRLEQEKAQAAGSAGFKPKF